MTGEKSLPLDGIRVCERSRTLAGRLAGLLLADQGAEVFAFSRARSAQEGLDDYLDRNKTLLPDIELAALANSDILINDGKATGTQHSWQIALGFTATVPGDDEFDLPADASDDLLNGMVGFYTDLGVTSRLLGRDVIYTPLPLCSVYAAVLGATAVSAALTDRQRSGSGRSIVVPRLAAGLSAIGVLAMSLEGIDPYLLPPELLSLPPELMAEVPKARANEAHMIWLVNRINPTTGCYRTLDGRLMMPVTTINRKLAIRMFEVLGIWERVLTLSVVDASPYDPASQSVKDRNVALIQDMRSDLSGQLAEWMEETFVQKTAAEWERLFGNAQVPCGAVQDFEEWKNCSWARQSGLVDAVAGLRHPQLGRSISVQSAKPYPALSAGRMGKSPLATNMSLPPVSGTPAIKPLSGYVVLDLANVIAGPACGRLLGELGATVFKMDTTRPDHQPLVTVIWGAEANQGKRSILADVRTAGGKAILRRLVKKADIVVMNATDSGTRQLGLSCDELAVINPRAIGVQISAFKGARPSTHDDFPGYDPLLQAATGIMTRFGTRDMPLLHGIASCVDYLTGYLGAFATTVALQARERRCNGTGDWVDTSLASGASLTQLLFQWGPPVASAVGPTATGPSSFARLYQQSDGWIFADASVDVSVSLSGLNVADAIASLRMDGILAAPVRSIADLKQKYISAPSSTIRFRTVGKGGLRATVLEPTWFLFEGKTLPFSSEPSKPGSDAAAILSELGFTPDEAEIMVADKSVGQANWQHLKSETT